MKKVRSKLRPTEIGVIKTFSLSPDDEVGEIAVQCSACTYYYNNLAELCEKWEDYEEPVYYYFIQDDGRIGCDAIEPYNHKPKVEEHKSIGNYFLSREEAEKAVEKLRALTRLKGKGFRFDGYDVAHKSNGNLSGQIFYDAGNYSIEDVEKEMDLLFGGEECD